MSVIQFPDETVEVMQCVECESTTFKVLADGVPMCNECETPMPMLLCPFPQWLIHKGAEGNG